MIEKIRAMKNKKGFTLVELIVVLAILAILAALLIPALTGYIDKANKEKVISETRMVAMAVQTEASEAYGKLSAGGTLKGATWAADSDHVTNIKKLAEVLGSDDKSFKADVYADGSIKTIVYDDGTYTCTYTASDKSYNTVNHTEKLTNVVTFVEKNLILVTNAFPAIFLVAGFLLINCEWNGLARCVDCQHRITHLLICRFVKHVVQGEKQEKEIVFL